MCFRNYILVLFLFACHLAYASENLCFDHYTTKNGVCCDFILNINQDKNGFIWIATKDGVSRFDGTNFKNYSKKQGGLMENEVLCIQRGEDDQLYAGGNNGMLQAYDAQSDQFVSRQFPDLTGKYAKTVHNISRDRKGHDFLLTTSGIFSYDSTSQTFGKEPFLSDSTYHLLVNEFYQDKNDLYWVGAFDGLHILDKKGKEMGFYSLSKDKAPVSSILEVDSANVLVATNMGGVWLFKVGDGLPQASLLPTPFKNVSVMMKDSKGFVWLGTWGDGLWRMERMGAFTEIKSYGNEDDLQKTHTLFEDSNHNIWIGTQVNGLFRLQTDNDTKILHSSEMGYPKVDASCFIERGDGDIYVGSDGSGAFLVSPEGRMKQNLQQHFSVMGASLLSFCKGEKDNLLVSSWFGGIGEISADGKVTPIKYEGLNNTTNSSKCVRLMQNGELWVATQGDGVYVRNKEGKWSKHELVVNEDVKDRWIDDMEEDANGIKWMLSNQIIWRYDGEKLRMFNAADSTQTAEPCKFTDCVCDAEGNLYIATNYGIARIVKESKKIEFLDYTPVAKFSSVNFDKNGYLWCSGETGIHRVNIQKNTYKTIPLPTDKYGKLYFQPRAIYESSKGTLFFGCSNGFIVLDPSKLGVANAVDYAAWAQAQCKMEDGEVQLLDLQKESVKIGYNNDETRIQFDVVSLTGPDVICRYRIGEQDDWHNLGSAREIVLNHLSSGKYNLELMAFKDGGEANAITLHKLIKVERPWWLSWWFITLSILALGGLGYALYLRRKREKEQEEKARKEYEEKLAAAATLQESEQTNNEGDLPKKPEIHPFMAQVFEVIEHNYEDPDFSVEELAKELNTSKSTLIRKLKPLTEQTPIEMISEFRLKRADEMLRTMDLPVKEVAFKTGFNSPYYFSRKYKEFFGFPPSQIKEKE